MWAFVSLLAHRATRLRFGFVARIEDLPLLRTWIIGLPGATLLQVIARYAQTLASSIRKHRRLLAVSRMPVPQGTFDHLSNRILKALLLRVPIKR